MKKIENIGEFPVVIKQGKVKIFPLRRWMGKKEFYESIDRQNAISDLLKEKE
jgi:hypothetical protein